jgi:methyltransferase
VSKNLFVLFWCLLAIQRLVELAWSRRNREWMRRQGGFEVAPGHYPLIVSMHLLWFAATALEVLGAGAVPPAWWPVPFGLFLLAQAFRLWCIRSLGRYWNTRIVVVPGHPVVRKGPYRFLRHPNYLAVMAEFLLFPMMFGAWVTMVLLSAANAALLLFVRIPAEERALSSARVAGDTEV